MKSSFAIMLLCVEICVSCRNQSDEIQAANAKDYIGQTKTVTGTVHEVKITSRAVLLDIGGDYPNQPFTAVYFKQDKGAFTQFQGHKIAVTGTITDYKGKPEIIISSPAQIVAE